MKILFDRERSVVTSSSPLNQLTSN